MPTITRTVKIESLSCGVCGIAFGLTDTFHQKRIDDGADFYCPNGHRISYHNTSNAARLKQAQLAEQQADARADQLAARAARLENDLLDQVKQNRTLKRRATAGLCTSCNRSFPNVKRHYATKHPEQ